MYAVKIHHILFKSETWCALGMYLPTFGFCFYWWTNEKVKKLISNKIVSYRLIDLKKQISIRKQASSYGYEQSEKISHFSVILYYIWMFEITIETREYLNKSTRYTGLCLVSTI